MADDLEVLMTDEESDVYGLVVNSEPLCHRRIKKDNLKPGGYV